MSVRSDRRSLRQLVVGLAALPVSVLPLAAYATWTPQGQHLADRITVQIDPPHLPQLSGEEVASIRAIAPRYRGTVLPLVYHGVGSATAAEGDLAVSPERFAEHLAAMRAAGMHFVTASDVAAAFAGEAPLPDRAVLITFDDGRSDAVLFATPLLRQAGARATMFAITRAADADGSPYYASWDDLDPEVWDVQSHTSDLHRAQDTPDGSLPSLTSRAEGESRVEWSERVRADLDEADEAIEAETGRRPVAFAYPFGAYGADRTNDPVLRPLLAVELGRRYRLAFHQDDQETVAPVGPMSPALGVRRLEVGDWSGEELVARLASAARRPVELR